MVVKATRVDHPPPGLSLHTLTEAEASFSANNTRAINLLRGKPQALLELDAGTYFR